eukprot:2491225-Pyramimonas_sp.AAC.1
MVWKLARRIAGTGVGPKKRRFQALTKDPPALQDWVEYMGGEGRQGGMQTYVVAQGGEQDRDQVAVSDRLRQHVARHQAGQLSRFSDVPIEIQHRQQWDRHRYTQANHAEQDYRDLKVRLARAKRRRAVPEWAAPSE